MRILQSHVSALAVAAAALGTSVDASAQAPGTTGLAQFGPIEALSGFPLYYQDPNGLRLQMCRDAGLCFYEIPNAGLPLSFPDNFPDEQFYYAIEADAQGPGSALLYHQALEAAFANGAPAAGDQMVFSRFRLRMTGLADGVSYTVTWPYGQDTFVAGVDGPLPGTINVTRDIGTVAGQFQQALAGNVGPFVVPLGFASTLPGTYISDGATLTPVQGSPFGTNYVRVDGPGIGLLYPSVAVGADQIQINDFVVMGQIATTGGVGINKAYKSKTAAETAVNVWANGSPGAIMQVSVDGSLPVTMTDIGTPGSFYGRVLLGAGTDPITATVTNFSDAPPSVSSTNLIPDLVSIQSAVGFVGGNLVVTASSSDAVGGALTVTGPGIAPTVMPAGGVSSVVIPLAVNGAVPSEVSVSSASGGSDTQTVLVSVPAPVVADAGADQSVAAGAVVQLSGAASTGSIVAYEWTHDAGASIVLNGASTVSPLFVAPTSTLAVDITLTLLVRGSEGQVATDTVVVHVAPAALAVVANAGADQSVAAGATVNLSGLASTGPIVSYAWSQTGGTPVTLLGANTASASFVAPSNTTANSVTLSLTVTAADLSSSSDTVIVNVAAVIPPATDAVAINQARYVVNKNSWRVQGTAALRQGQQVRVYCGPVGDRTLLIGTANVSALGNWNIQSADRSGPAPRATDTSVWAESTLGGTAGVFTFTRN
ncbi:MAG: hypothetical protein ABL982_19130 [Vicinamibacterales bacterium]